MSILSSIAPLTEALLTDVKDTEMQQIHTYLIALLWLMYLAEI